ncbi:MAG: CPXCG motif-containing cysteine-rich protein [Zetaproteobacteria bacterium CG12_big_fil_rev_8_21_14_0_65_54_13]|nr:MAG: hypothetical protein COX55_07985 [Zetaproteobacteria bacterium CG23_combo_of_CG06-09_8_20_14_all_54_7]PIW45716.1 MAG: CPXCG motif-containing cysteine-rich protein [Zetaproteobacteria bacterium CG12_big_fil_rev_8_21_14_0_65_54_13]
MNMLEQISATCPYCGESIELTIEQMQQTQAYSEDCPVCCRPICVEVEADLTVVLRREDE